MRYYNGLQLEELTHEERKPLKTVKSSLKGSNSQLSLEKVAIEARKNAARRQTRNRADTILQGLLHSAEKARKVSTVAWLEDHELGSTAPCSLSEHLATCCRHEADGKASASVPTRSKSTLPPALLPNSPWQS